jgi:hypothetical protein
MSLPVLAAAAALALLLVGCTVLAVRSRRRGKRSDQRRPRYVERAPQGMSEPASILHAASPKAGGQARGLHADEPVSAAETAAGAPARSEAKEAPRTEQLVTSGAAAASSELAPAHPRESGSGETDERRAAARSSAPKPTRYQGISDAEPPAGQPAEPPAAVGGPGSGPTAASGPEAGAQAEAQVHTPAGKPTGAAEPETSSRTGADVSGPPPEELAGSTQPAVPDVGTLSSDAGAVPEDAAGPPAADTSAAADDLSADTPSQTNQDSCRDLTAPAPASEEQPETPGGQPGETLPPPLLSPPRPYRPAAPGSRRLRREPGTSIEERGIERPLPVCVRLVFERAGFCRVSLLAQRPSGHPEEIPIEGTGNPGSLAALQEDWYQDVVLEELGQALRTGISWQARPSSGQRARWALSGRDIVVLAPHEDLSGFVSCTRLVIGEEHVVLCTQSQLGAALEAIALAGGRQPVEMEAGTGVPDGWIGLRGVVPRNAVAPRGGGDILDVLRPLAQAEIAFDGGIRLSRACWLVGHPPEIHLRGDSAAAGTLYIDDHAAGPDPSGTYRVPGWDSPGEHLIRCASGTRTYQIATGREAWDAWDAYTWSAGGMDGGDGSKPSICGALLLAPRARRCGQKMLSVPATNPVLIGARPGEIYTSDRRSDIRTDDLSAFAPFEAVWALPADAFHCSKQSRVLSLRASAPVRLPAARGRIAASEAPQLLAWSSAILDASRKRLAVHPDDRALRKLWAEYRRTAHALRKRLK